MRKGLLTCVFWAKIALGGLIGYVTDEWGSYAWAQVIWITVWVVSKNESNCLVENKVVSALICKLISETFYGLLCSYLTTADIASYVHNKFPVSFLLYIATKKNYECSYHKKITPARFACLCLYCVTVQAKNCLIGVGIQTRFFKDSLI